MPSSQLPKALTPLFKWTGGKRRELPQILPRLPRRIQRGETYRYVEPFVGAGAVYWALQNPDSLLNDLDTDVMNFYEVMARQDSQFLAEVEKVAALFCDDVAYERREEAYYALRNLDRSQALSEVPNWLRAARFYVVNQLAFSGMRRFNKAGQFNVPFGHYKTFNPALLRSEVHAQLLSKTTLRNVDYAQVLEECDEPGTFIFLDPPYTRVMKTYSAHAELGEAAQRDLREALANMKHADWLMVIDKSPLTMELYGDMIADSYPLSYGVNIKNRFDPRAEHLVIANYKATA